MRRLLVGRMLVATRVRMSIFGRLFLYCIPFFGGIAGEPLALAACLAIFRMSGLVGLFLFCPLLLMGILGSGSTGFLMDVLSTEAMCFVSSCGV